jgi:hypothetical protein
MNDMQGRVRKVRLRAAAASVPPSGGSENVLDAGTAELAVVGDDDRPALGAWDLMQVAVVPPPV